MRIESRDRDARPLDAGAPQRRDPSPRSPPRCAPASACRRRRAAARARSRARSTDRRACCIRCTRRSSRAGRTPSGSRPDTDCRARLSASLLNGVNMMPSWRCAFAAVSASPKLRIANVPPSAVACAIGMVAGSRCFRSTKTGRAGCAAALSNAPTVSMSRLTPAACLAQRQHAPVADHRDRGQREKLLLTQQLGQQFRADPGRIAHGDHHARRLSLIICRSPRQAFHAIAYCIQSAIGTDFSSEGSTLAARRARAENCGRKLMSMIVRFAAAGGGPGAGRPGRLGPTEDRLALRPCGRGRRVADALCRRTRQAGEREDARPRRDPRVSRLAARKPERDGRQRAHRLGADGASRFLLARSLRQGRGGVQRAVRVPQSRARDARDRGSDLAGAAGDQPAPGREGRRAHRRQLLSRRAPAHRALSGEVAEGHGRARNSAPCRWRCGIR